MSSILKFPRMLKQALCLTLSMSITLMGFVPSVSQAQAVTCNAYSADNGTDARCGARRIGSVPVSYVKLQWSPLSDMAVPSADGNGGLKGGSSAIELANKSALALGLNASDIANVVTMFPSNVPYTFARYNPADMTLKIDVFKLEKVVKNGQIRAGLYHASFGPSQGDYWKANRSYISPDAYKTGQSAGVNPFESFKQGGTDLFVNISGAGAQVAIGHAMRLAGAPLGLFSVATPRMSSTTKTSGGLFTKKTTTTVFGHVKPTWYLAQPLNLLARSTTLGQASICATDPAAASCPAYATAVSGVSMEEFDGGTLSAVEDTWQIDQQSKSGLSFFGALVLGVIGSFAIVGVLGMAGIGAGAVAGGASAVPMGVLGSLGVQVGAVGVAASAVGSVAIEALLIAGAMHELGGANLGSVIGGNNLGTMFSLGIVSVGSGAAPPLSDYAGRINQRVAPLVTSDMTRGRTSLAGFDNTVMGNCAPGVLLSACSGNSGMIQRTDQFIESNEVQFTRDNGGALIRSDTVTGK